MGWKKQERGYSYLIVMFAVAVLSILSVRAIEHTYAKELRAKEAELLFVGAAYRNAIREYYDMSPGTAKSYPASLEDLLLDNRTTTMRRPLRKLYRDPMTGSSEWGLVRNDEGKIIGVYSLSGRKPMKTGGFSTEFASFASAKTYSDWRFIYQSSSN